MVTGIGNMVTVIVPVYNSEDTLGRCMDSILAQSYRDFELLVVDNGSSDASLDIARDYAGKDSRVKVLMQPVRGVSAARNMGLDHASGEYVAFCDSDDMVEEDWLSCMVSGIDDAGLAVCGYNLHDAGISRKFLAGVQRFSRVDKGIETLLRAGLLQYVWNKLFRRSVIESAGLRFDGTFTVFEDEYFVLGYLGHSPCMTSVPYCGYDYFLPAGFRTKYDFSLDAFHKVAERICSLVSGAPERVRLPSIVYWYKVSLGGYAATHTYRQTKDRIAFARKLAGDFHDGPFNHLMLRILPDRCIYHILRIRQRG